MASRTRYVARLPRGWVPGWRVSDAAGKGGNSQAGPGEGEGGLLCRLSEAQPMISSHMTQVVPLACTHPYEVHTPHYL